MKIDIKTAIFSSFFTVALMSFVSVNEPPKNLTSSPAPAFEMYNLESGKILVFNKYNGEIEYKEIDDKIKSNYSELAISSWPSFGSLDIDLGTQSRYGLKVDME